MAFEDSDDQNQNDSAEERDRMLFRLLTSSRIKSPLPAFSRAPEEAATPSASLLGRPVAPRVPAPREIPLTTPTVESTTESYPRVLGLGASRPTRPDVMPTRADFPAKPEVSGVRKYLGLGLSALAGLNDPRAVGPLVEGILHGQRDKSERQYQQSIQDWERGLSDQEKQAQIEEAKARTGETQARTASLRNPPQKEGVTPEETTIHDLMAGANGQPRINPDTGKPYTYLEAYGAVQQAKQGAKPEKTPSFEEQTFAEWQKTHPKGTRLQFANEQVAGKASAEAAARFPYEKSLKDQEIADNPVFAVDPKTNQRLQTTVGEAKQKGYSNPVKVSQGDVEKEYQLNSQINDMQLNTSRYRVALNKMATVGPQERLAITHILSDPSVNNLLLQGVGMPAVVSMAEQSGKGRDWNSLKPATQDALIGYLRMKNTALLAQKALTGMGRASKEAMDIELANMPSPIEGATVGNKKLDAWQQNIDQIATRSVRLPGQDQAQDVRKRIESQQ